MPRSQLMLPPGSFHFVTTSRADKFTVGDKIRNPRKQGEILEIVAIVQATENGATVYHIWAKLVEDED